MREVSLPNCNVALHLPNFCKCKEKEASPFVRNYFGCRRKGGLKFTVTVQENINKTAENEEFQLNACM